MFVCEGVRVRVKRAGDMIPKVLGLAPHSLTHDDACASESRSNEYEFSMPSECPACGSAVEAVVPSKRVVSTPPSEGVSSVMYRCSGGYKCSAQRVELIR